MLQLFIALFLILTSTCFGEEIAEFCADFDKDPNEYSLHLTKNLEFAPNINWELSDSTICTTNSDQFFLEANYTIDAPSDSSMAEFKGGCVVFNNFTAENMTCINPKNVKINLAPSNRDILHIHKKNAKESLIPYYGKVINGKLKTKLPITSYIYETNFKAVIIGPCIKKRIVAEFCINKSHELVLEKELDYIPRYIFSTASECHFCNKNYKETLSFFIDFGNEKYIPLEDILHKRCEDYILHKNLKLPQAINKESFYNKDLSVRIDAKIEKNGSYSSDYYDFKIRINGPCKK